MDEVAYFIAPVGVTIKAYQSSNKAYDVRAVIRDWQHIIRQRFFADFLALGSEQVGTQSLAKEMNTFFKLALVSVQRKLLETWNKQLIPYLFTANNWIIDDKHIPRIVWNDPSSINIQSLAQAYAELVNVDLLTPTPMVKKWVREQLRLPFEEEIDDTELNKLDKEGKVADTGVGVGEGEGEAKGEDEEAEKPPSTPAKE